MLGWQQNGHEERSCTWLSRRMFLRRMVANNSFMAFDHSLGRMGPAVPSSQANDPTNFGRIDRNVAWWSTSHERTQSQRFKLVSPMHQKTPMHQKIRHAVDRVGFRAGVDTCRACAQENLGRHWHCAEHQVHLCPNCAELQPEVPTIWVGARYFGRIVPSFGLKSF